MIRNGLTDLSRRGALGLALLGGVALSGVARAQEKALTIALTADAVILDPHAANELTGNIMFYHFYDPLVARTPELGFEPGLAESWQVVDDTTWVFKLRKGVTFHNGDELKASDVVFTFERLKKALMSNLVANIASSRAIDDYTVEIKTPKPYAVLHMALAEVLIVSEKYTKATGDEQMGLKPMGTGPYKLTEWVKEDRIVLAAHGDYWRGKPKIAELTAAGTPQEREKTPDNDSGYLWRLNAYWRYEEVPGGVLIECESVSLSRSVPMLFRPLVNPIANRLARGSLESTLISLRGVLAPQLKSAS